MYQQIARKRALILNTIFSVAIVVVLKLASHWVGCE